MTDVEIDESGGFMSHKTAKVPPHKAMPPIHKYITLPDIDRERERESYAAVSFLLHSPIYKEANHRGIVALL